MKREITVVAQPVDPKDPSFVHIVIAMPKAGIHPVLIIDHKTNVVIQEADTETSGILVFEIDLSKVSRIIIRSEGLSATFPEEK